MLLAAQTHAAYECNATRLQHCGCLLDPHTKQGDGGKQVETLTTPADSGELAGHLHELVLGSANQAVPGL